MIDRQTKWDKRFLDLSKHVSKWSKDPSTKVGSIITDDTKIVSMGFNGLPQTIKDSSEILNDREKKYKYIIHAETNAILTAARDLSGCTIYTYPFLPCSNCASMISQTGIKRVVSLRCENERWIKLLEDSKKFMNLCGLEVIEYLCI